MVHRSINDLLVYFTQQDQILHLTLGENLQCSMSLDHSPSNTDPGISACPQMYKGYKPLVFCLGHNFQSIRQDKCDSVGIKKLKTTDLDCMLSSFSFASPNFQVLQRSPGSTHTIKSLNDSHKVRLFSNLQTWELLLLLLGKLLCPTSPIIIEFPSSTSQCKFSQLRGDVSIQL